jgi:enoyl-CoA hydratase/carnithine racemase
MLKEDVDMTRTVMGPWETLDVEVDGPILLIRLNRPERLNALSPTMLAELREIWPLYDSDTDLRVAIVTGAGDRAFCSGADVATVSDLTRNRTSDHFRENRFTPVQAKISKPSICAINGICASAGLHFVADCDFAIAADSATFLDTHVSVGQVSALEPIGLARRIPLGAVLRMVLMGRHERLDAHRAYELGLITEVVPAAGLLERARELAALIARNSPAAVRISREVVWDSYNHPLDVAMALGFVRLRAHADHHPDAQEGPRAFFEKREVNWEPPT